MSFRNLFPFLLSICSVFLALTHVRIFLFSTAFTWRPTSLLRRARDDVVIVTADNRVPLGRNGEDIADYLARVARQAEYPNIEDEDFPERFYLVAAALLNLRYAQQNGYRFRRFVYRGARSAHKCCWDVRGRRWLHCGWCKLLVTRKVFEEEQEAVLRERTLISEREQQLLAGNDLKRRPLALPPPPAGSRTSFVTRVFWLDSEAFVSDPSAGSISIFLSKTKELCPENSCATGHGPRKATPSEHSWVFLSNQPFKKRGGCSCCWLAKLEAGLFEPVWHTWYTNYRPPLATSRRGGDQSALPALLAAHGGEPSPASSEKPSEESKQPSVADIVHHQRGRHSKKQQSYSISSALCAICGLRSVIRCFRVPTNWKKAHG